MEDPRAHFDALRDSRFARLVLIPRVLPESGTIDANVEVLACLHDPFFLQLANEQNMKMADLMAILNSMG
jgi:hypothetical protein